MRKKVSTHPDESRYRRAKIESYLNDEGRTAGGVRAVDESWGALRISPDALRRIMDDRDWLDS